MEARKAIGAALARAVLIAAATVLYGALLGLACRAQADAPPVPCCDGISLDHLDVPALPPGEEMYIAPDDALAVVIPSRRGRWGRPLDCAHIAHTIVFTARFASFPEYKPDDAPTLRGGQ